MSKPNPSTKAFQGLGFTINDWEPFEEIDFEDSEAQTRKAHREAEHEAFQNETVDETDVDNLAHRISSAGRQSLADFEVALDPTIRDREGKKLRHEVAVLRALCKQLAERKEAVRRQGSRELAKQHGLWDKFYVPMIKRIGTAYAELDAALAAEGEFARAIEDAGLVWPFDVPRLNPGSHLRPGNPNAKPGDADWPNSAATWAEECRQARIKI